MGWEDERDLGPLSKAMLQSSDPRTRHAEKAANDFLIRQMVEGSDGESEWLRKFNRMAEDMANQFGLPVHVAAEQLHAAMRQLAHQPGDQFDEEDFEKAKDELEVIHDDLTSEQ